MEGYPFSLRQEVVLRDLDGFGHVNNAVYLTYVENARVGYLREVVGVAGLADIRNVMASVTLEFRAQLGFGDELEIGVRAERLGNKSFDLRYLLTRGDGVPAAEASSVQVMFDFERGEAVPVPAEWRQAIAAHDGIEAGAG